MSTLQYDGAKDFAGSKATTKILRRMYAGAQSLCNSEVENCPHPMLEEILDSEVEHAEDLSSLLAGMKD
jgi:hypothetical protein